MARPPVHPTTDIIYFNLGNGLIVADEEVSWNLLRFLDACIAEDLGRVDDVVRDAPPYSGWESSFDPENAPEEGLDWLGQFVGARVDTLGDVLEKRARIVSRESFVRGSNAAIITAAQRTLTGAKTVYLIERDAGSAYQLRVHTLIAQTPDAAATEAAIRSQKPAGIVLTYSAIAAQPIDALVGSINAQVGTIDGLT